MQSNTTPRSVMPTRPSAQPSKMESYFFSYTYSNPPVINGIAPPQSYIGSGFAKVGSYHMGQTIAVFDVTGLRQVGTYTIGKVNDAVKYDAKQLNHLSILEYDYGTSRNTSLGTSSGSTTGLGQERGLLLGAGLEGNGAFFSNQSAAIRAYHF